MTIRTITILDCDMGGCACQDDVATVQFGVAPPGTTAIGWREMELCAFDRDGLVSALVPFIGCARKPARPPRNTAARRRSARIRVWARAQGIEVGDHGRMRTEVITAYDAAH